VAEVVIFVQLGLEMLHAQREVLGQLVTKRRESGIGMCEEKLKIAGFDTLSTSSAVTSPTFPAGSYSEESACCLAMLFRMGMRRSSSSIFGKALAVSWD